MRLYTLRPGARKGQIQSQGVDMIGFETLTRKVARAALRVAFGDDCNAGIVWDDRAGFGYRVYARSARKIYEVSQLFEKGSKE